MVASYSHQQVSVQQSCDAILRSIRFLNLHFTMQETPFSLYVTVRKKHVMDKIEPIENNDTLLNSELVEIKEKYDMLVKNNEELTKLLEMRDIESKKSDKVIQDLNLKLKKAELEAQEASAKNDDTKKKLDDLSKTHNKVKDDNIRTQSENSNLQMELKEARKVVKVKEKEEYRMMSKIDNLENSVRNLKQESREAVNERNQTSKEKTKLENQISKLKERKSSVSKSTWTDLLVYCSEASTSTVGTESAQSSTLSTTSQTDHHPEIPYEIGAPLPPIFSSSLVFKSKSLFLSRS